MKLWKSMQKGMKSSNGNVKWKIGQWQHEDKISMCNSGFHASKRIIDAMGFVNMEVLAEVEVKGKSDKQDDKQVWSDMRILRAWEWTKKDSVALSIFSAELCLKNFEKVYPDDKRPRQAIEAAKKWLKNPTKKNQLAAGSAAESAAWSAAESAAWSAVKSAAWSAAESAAGSAAKSAAWSAEGSDKLLKVIEKWIIKRIPELKEIK